MRVSIKIGVPQNQFSGIFLTKASILGSPIYGNTQIDLRRMGPLFQDDAPETTQSAAMSGTARWTDRWSGSLLRLSKQLVISYIF